MDIDLIHLDTYITLNLGLIGSNTDMEMVTVTFEKDSNGQPVRTSQPILFNFSQKGNSGCAALISYTASILIMFALFI